MALIRSPFIDVREFARRVDVLPDDVLYHDYPATEQTLTNFAFKIVSPAKGRALCYAMAWLEADITFSSLQDDGVTARAIAAAADNLAVVARKPGLSIQANAVTDATMRWKSYVGSIRSREVLGPLQELYLGRKGSKELSYAGGEFDSRQPVQFINRHGASTYVYNAARNLSYDAIDDMPLFQRAGRDMLTIVSRNGQNTFTLKFWEPVCVGLFNPFEQCKDMLPNSSPFKRMSTVIPYLDDAEIRFNLNKVETCLDYVRSGAAGAITDKLLATAVSGVKLHTYWYQKPYNEGLNTAFRLQSYHIDVRSSSAQTIANGASAAMSLRDMQNSTVPTLMFIYVEVAKSSSEWEGSAFTNIGDDAFIARTYRAELTGLKVRINAQALTIDTDFTVEQMYNLTRKNAKMYDFPWSQQAYQNGGVQFVALRPEDISSKFPSGTSSGFHVDVDIDAVYNRSGAQYAFTLYVAYLYGDQYITAQLGQVTETEINEPAENIRQLMVNKDLPVVQNLNLGPPSGAGFSRRSNYRSRIA